MGVEELVDTVSDCVGDFAGDISENIKDAVVEVDEFSKNAMENLGDKGLEALEKGDLVEAVECSDMSKEDKELAKDVVEGFKLNGNLIISGVKIVGGVLAVVLALKGVDILKSYEAGALAVKGVQEIVKGINSKKANALANA